MFQFKFVREDNKLKNMHGVGDSKEKEGEEVESRLKNAALHNRSERDHWANGKHSAGDGRAMNDAPIGYRIQFKPLISEADKLDCGVLVYVPPPPPHQDLPPTTSVIW